jgi:hypothetical protein
MVPAAPWLGLGAWGQWPLGVASYTGASTGRYGCHAAYARYEAGSLSRQPARPGDMAGTTPLNTVMGPDYARSVPLPYSLAFTHHRSCVARMYTRLRWFDGAIRIATSFDPLDERVGTR